MPGNLPGLELRMLVEDLEEVLKRIMTLIQGMKDGTHGRKLTSLRSISSEEVF